MFKVNIITPEQLAGWVNNVNPAPMKFLSWYFVHAQENVFQIHVLVSIMVCHVQTACVKLESENYVFRDSDINDIESDYLSFDDEIY